MRKNKNIFLVIMLYLSGVINYLDRAAISLSMVFIATDLSLSNFEKGLVFGSFSFGYLIFNFLGGYLADRIYPLKLLLFCIVVWSLASGMTGLTSALWQLLIVRIFFGMAEGPLSTNINKIVDMCFSNSNKAVMISLIDSATPVGTAIAGILVPFISYNFNWRISFFAIMSLGIIWSILWKIFLLKPGYVLDLAAEKTTSNHSVDIKRENVINILFLTVCYFSYNYLLYFLITWFPVFILSNHYLDKNSITIINSLPWLVGSLAMLLGGGIIQKTRGIMHKEDKNIFIVTIAFCLIVSGISTTFLGIFENSSAILVIISVAVFSLYFTGGLYWAALNEMVPFYKVGTIGGRMHGFANIASLIAPVFTGIFLEYNQNYTILFISVGCIGIFGGIVTLINIYFSKTEKGKLC